MTFQEKINQIEDEFLSKEETPENIQWLFERMMELINSDEFAEEVLMHGARFDALFTPSYDEDYSPSHRAEVQWEGCFTPEQKKAIEDSANAQIDAFVDSIEDDSEPILIGRWNY